MTAIEVNKPSAKRKTKLTVKEIANLRASELLEDVPKEVWGKLGECHHTSVECDAAIVAKIGQRVDMKCWASYRLRNGGTRACGERRSVVWGDAPPAFLKPDRAPNNETKLLCLWALAMLGGTATAEAIADRAGIPATRARPFLYSAWKRAMPYVSRSAERVPLAISSAYRWNLSDRAYLWLQWAKEQGMMSDGKA